MFYKANRASKIEITIKCVAFRNGKDSAVFPLFRDMASSETVVEKSSKCFGTGGACMFKHFIANTCRAAGFSVWEL